MLITVGEADQTGLTMGGCSGKYAAEEGHRQMGLCNARILVS